MHPLGDLPLNIATLQLRKKLIQIINSAILQLIQIVNSATLQLIQIINIATLYLIQIINSAILLLYFSSYK